MIDITALLDAVILEALTAGASDIHIQPYPDQYRIRFRIDGLLQQRHLCTFGNAIQLIARIKVLAHLDVAEKRRPQDGSFTFLKGSAEADCRIALFPSHYGEKVVIRLFDRVLEHRRIHNLGFSQFILERVNAHMQSDSGFFLITGPTGSGKTTTAHALLSSLSADKNIVTLEDPIEYHISGVTQSQIQPELGLTFESGLRALLRQDPDVLLVGEIRDSETAQVAVQAALTGHQVISTMHTTDAPGALMRLTHMGCEPFLLAAALKLIIAQRLVRTLCRGCRYEVIPSQEQKFLLTKYGNTHTSLYEAKGCLECFNRGYKGRVGIFQLLEMNSEMRKLLTQGADYDQIVQFAYTKGTYSLAEEAVDMLKQGIIGFKEWISLVNR